MFGYIRDSPHFRRTESGDSPWPPRVGSFVRFLPLRLRLLAALVSHRPPARRQCESPPASRALGPFRRDSLRTAGTRCLWTAATRSPLWLAEADVPSSAGSPIQGKAATLSPHSIRLQRNVVAWASCPCVAGASRPCKPRAGRPWYTWPRRPCHEKRPPRDVVTRAALAPQIRHRSQFTPSPPRARNRRKASALPTDAPARE
jgi:hypothetical protein